MFYSFGVLLKQQRRGNAQEKVGMEQERGCTDVSKRWRRPRCLRNQTVRNKRKIIRGKPLKCFWGAHCYPSCRKTLWEDQLSPTTKKPRAQWLSTTALFKCNTHWNQSGHGANQKSKITLWQQKHRIWIWVFYVLLFVGSLHLLRI